MQSLGLILGAPFVFLAGWSGTVPMLIAALMGAGLCKGIYDANIFASLFDVVRPEDRGTAAGLMNTVGWTGGFVAPTAVGLASEHFGLSVAIASTAVVYFLVGLLRLAAARTWQSADAVEKKHRRPVVTRAAGAIVDSRDSIAAVRRAAERGSR